MALPPIDKSHNCVLGNLTQKLAGGTENPLLALPTDLLDTITAYVATGATVHKAAANAIRWGLVSASTHLSAHEPCIADVINHAKHLDQAFVILWNYSFVPQLARQLSPGTFIPQMTPKEARDWIMCGGARPPPNALLLDKITAVNLSRCGLKVIPFEINYLCSLRELRLEGNQITRISSQAFEGCWDLRELRLESNRITTIAPQAFEGCDSLERLHLDNNRITTIASLAFEGCEKTLEELHLDNNQITTIAPQAFNGCKTLRWLNFSKNQIIQIHPQTFTSCTALISLHLNHNRITHIYPETFASCLSLLELNLNNNLISDIAPQTFVGCPALNWMGLASNLITHIAPQTFAGCQALASLKLENNLITQLDPQVIAGCEALSGLYLHGNSLLCTLEADENNYLARFKAFSGYVCRSELAAFYQALSEGRLPALEILERLSHLEDRHLIYEMVYLEATAAAEKEKRAFSGDGDLQWGEDHVCDDMPIFYRALKRAVQEKFDRLSAEQKQAVHLRIAVMAQENDEDPRKENVLRFIDAMKGVL